MHVLASPSMMSRASRPLSLTVPPEIFRFVTKVRMSFSEALVLRGDFRPIKDAQQRVLAAKQPFERPVEHHVAGSATLEDAIEAGAQDLGLLRVLDRQRTDPFARIERDWAGHDRGDISVQH